MFPSRFPFLSLKINKIKKAQSIDDLSTLIPVFLRLTLYPRCFTSLLFPVGRDETRWKNMGRDLRDLASFLVFYSSLYALDNRTLTFPFCKIWRNPLTSSVWWNGMENLTEQRAWRPCVHSVDMTEWWGRSIYVKMCTCVPDQGLREDRRAMRTQTEHWAQAGSVDSREQLRKT